MKTLLTTSELIKEAERLMEVEEMPGVQLSHGKLLRWQRDGLLPRQQTRGAGPGERKESLWEKSCIERLQLIAGYIKEERLNRKAAEQALIAAGVGVRGDLLRKHLLALSKQMAADLNKQERGHNLESVDRADKVERSTSQRMSTHGELVKAIFTACNLGYKGLSQEAECFKSIAELASFFQPDALRKLIENSKPDQLEQIYENPLVVFFANLGTSFFLLVGGSNKELPMLGVADDILITRLIDTLAPRPSGKLRRKKPYPFTEDKLRYYTHLVMVLFYLVYLQHGQALLPHIKQVINDMLDWPEFAIPENFKKILNSATEELNALFDMPSMPQ
ncbi:MULTISPECIES: hypothetical protein [Nitrosomonas]|uniref:Uncharacterized protein n=1 Tax=Nitrosomonas communis TaxID=44574 RepID=A0A0F7KD77_9PROT|nr:MULTISPECIES: hypothetical protein [Nitrosomonas]AKH38460.1 hypothetical protein AAW31_12710 [Nitrosomonas communis]TYP87778.1 hypothetical protein BCL69_102310 [Nitrosomonas communis]UVS60492.1 hypothetical protein NX761_13380 [Nitrosomonas sp. PLL12]